MSGVKSFCNKAKNSAAVVVAAGSLLGSAANGTVPDAAPQLDKIKRIEAVESIRRESSRPKDKHVSSK